MENGDLNMVTSKRKRMEIERGEAPKRNTFFQFRMAMKKLTISKSAEDSDSEDFEDFEDSDSEDSDSEDSEDSDSEDSEEEVHLNQGGKGATLKKEPKEYAPITENEVKAAMRKFGPVPGSQIVTHFRHRLNSNKAKKNFVDIMKKICLQKEKKYIVLKEPYIGKEEAGVTVKKEPKESGSRASPSTSVIPEITEAAITENELKAAMQSAQELGPVTALQIVKRFMNRLNSLEEKKNFVHTMHKITRAQKGEPYVVLKKPYRGKEEAGATVKKEPKESGSRASS